MIVGDPLIFAIESSISQAYDRLSLRALGFFVIHVGGRRFGVHKPDATLLACSFDQVHKRLASRGEHTAPFATEPDAGKIADAFRQAIFSDESADIVLGVPLPEFRALFHSKTADRMWAPDGDEAFDDGSYVLQFDFKDRVRLIAFQSDEGYGYESGTLRDVWIAADDFYDTLQRWHDAFEEEWAALPKQKA
jgi:hypothetical protein